MAFLTYDCGTDVAEIFEGDNDGYLIKIFDEDKDPRPDRGCRFYKRIEVEDGRVFPTPQDEPENTFVSGPPGSGKSYWVANYCRMMQYLQPKRYIYLISDVHEDKCLDTIKNLKRIPIDESWIEDPVKPEELECSVVIFDDIDSLDKELKRPVDTLKDKLLKTSRHHDIYVIVTNHLSTDHNNTKMALHCCTNLVVFPRSGMVLNRLLNDYGGLDKNQMRIIKDCPSRWVFISKRYPLYYVWNRGVELLK